MVLEVWTDLADEILGSGTWEARSVFCLAWSPVSMPCAVRGPSSGWLMPLCLGPELMNVNIQAQPTIDNPIQMACSLRQRTQHLCFGWAQTNDRRVRVRMNALSLALTQRKSAAIFVFLLLANSKYTPSYDMKEMFFPYFLYIFLSWSQ